MLRMLVLYIYLQALIDSNLPRLQLELYKEIKKVMRCVLCCESFLQCYSLRLTTHVKC